MYFKTYNLSMNKEPGAAACAAAAVLGVLRTGMDGAICPPVSGFEETLQVSCTATATSLKSAPLPQPARS